MLVIVLVDVCTVTDILFACYRLGAIPIFSTAQQRFAVH